MVDYGKFGKSLKGLPIDKPHVQYFCAGLFSVNHGQGKLRSHAPFFKQGLMDRGQSWFYSRSYRMIVVTYYRDIVRYAEIPGGKGSNSSCGYSVGAGQEPVNGYIEIEQVAYCGIT